jgi:hypothetical protein
MCVDDSLSLPLCTSSLSCLPAELSPSFSPSKIVKWLEKIRDAEEGGRGSSCLRYDDL